MEDPLLPFSWAKEQGVMYRCHQQQHQILIRTGASAEALSEARRVLPRCALMSVEAATFETVLVETYQQSSTLAQQMTDGLGNELNLYQLADTLSQDEDLLDSDDGAPVIRMINAMLAEAIKDGASDIHIEPFERGLSIRFRVDGVLRPVLTPQHQLAPLLASRIKVMAQLDIAEKRLPQDGRIALKIGGRAIDVRVSTLPTRHGERIVLRILDKNAVKLDLTLLGLHHTHLNTIQTLIRRPHGILLVTGPTGSGKSTTLYAALNTLNRQDRNIMTVEDPVEYELDGIGQTQVNPRVDMTFARGLRAILRQDPDVLMVGEIRDRETAQIAVQASLTGHLVLSTLHTNSATGAIARLQDMGIEPFLLAGSLLGVLAQRLVRTLCPDCRRPIETDTTPFRQAGFSHLSPGKIPLWHPVGCEKCHFSGYRGRTGIHELLLVDDGVRDAIARGENEALLSQHCSSAGYRHLYYDGLDKILHGLTTLEEVLRVTGEH